MNQSTTIIITVLSGVAIFVIGQILLKLVIEPIAAFRQRVGEIAYLLLNHQAQIVNASSSDENACTECKKHAANLIVAMSQIPAYRLVAAIFRLPRRSAVSEAARELNGISHNIRPGREVKHSEATENMVALKKLGTLLRIQTQYS